MKEINSQKIQNKLRNKFIKSGVKMIGPETIFFSEDTIIGKNVIIEITKHNTPCVTLNKIHPLLMESILGRRGLLAKVESIGKVKPGDSIEIL